MLLPKDIAPEDCIYYNGAIVLKVLQNNQRMKLSDLFCEIKRQKNITFATLLLCLDWLFLIDAATFKNEEVVLCS